MVKLLDFEFTRLQYVAIFVLLTRKRRVSAKTLPHKFENLKYRCKKLNLNGINCFQKPVE